MNPKSFYRSLCDRNFDDDIEKNSLIKKMLWGPRYGGKGKVVDQEAKYVERWPNTTSALAGWSRFDIPVDRYGGVHSLLICTSSPLRRYSETQCEGRKFGFS